MFLKRSLEYSHFEIDAPLSHKKNPPNWKHLSIDGTYCVRTLFEEEEVDIVLSANATILRVHYCTQKTICSKRSKRVGIALPVNDNYGCSVMITLDLFTNIALPPFIIFTGVFDSYLMNKYKDTTKATVLFIDTYWMTSAANMLYFKYSLNFYRDKKLDLYMIKHLVIAVKLYSH